MQHERGSVMAYLQLYHPESESRDRWPFRGALNTLIFHRDLHDFHAGAFEDESTTPPGPIILFHVVSDGPIMKPQYT